MPLSTSVYIIQSTPSSCQKKSISLAYIQSRSCHRKMDLVTFSKWAVNRSAVTHNRNRFNSFNNSSRPTHHPGICNYVTALWQPVQLSTQIKADVAYNSMAFSFCLSGLLHPPTPHLSFKLQLNISLLLVRTSHQSNPQGKLYSFNRGVLHGSQVGCQEKKNYLTGTEKCINAKNVLLLCHPTWLPHKSSIIAIKTQLPVVRKLLKIFNTLSCHSRSNYS